jgi:hypothetical protein
MIDTQRGEDQDVADLAERARREREFPWRRESGEAGWLPAADRAFSFSKA